MKMNLRTISQILPNAEFFGLSGKENFDFFDVAYLKYFETLFPQENILYFVVYEDKPEQLGWYNKPFDRSFKIRNLSVNEKIVFVADKRVSNEQLQGIRNIRVDNVYDAIDKIRRYVVSRVNPKIIGVTGSVGKTTGTALIQRVLQKKFTCERVYSKRLTPLTLSSWLINFLQTGHEILTLEYSMYRKNHIDKLTDLLRPNIGVFLNIRKMHFGVKGINTLYDIMEGKSDLVRKSEISLLNADDMYMSTIKRKGDLEFSLINQKADAFIKDEGDRATLFLNYTNQIISFAPYIKTNLFYYQASVAGLLGSLFGVPPELIAVALQEFKPAENRINWIDIMGAKVLFDADVTISGRFLALTEHRYPSSILLIHSFDFGEENVQLQIEDLSDAFSKFNEVRILDTEENRNLLSKYSLKNFYLVPRDKFFLSISDYEFRVFHFGTYFRKHKDLNYLKTFLNT